MTMMKKEYCKPETRYVSLVSPYIMNMGSVIVIPGGGAGESNMEPEMSRNSFWEDFDEDALQDMDREELKELE